MHEFGNARMAGYRAAGIRAGDHQRVPRPRTEIRGQPFDPKQRRDNDMMPALTQHGGGALRIGLGPGDEKAHGLAQEKIRPAPAFQLLPRLRTKPRGVALVPAAGSLERLTAVGFEYHAAKGQHIACERRVARDRRAA
jgi:hypothetical protein